MPVGDEAEPLEHAHRRGIPGFDAGADSGDAGLGERPLRQQRDALARQSHAAGARDERVADLDLAISARRTVEAGVADGEAVGAADDHEGEERPEPHWTVRLVDRAPQAGQQRLEREALLPRELRLSVEQRAGALGADRLEPRPAVLGGPGRSLHVRRAEAPQPQRVGDDRDARERHRQAGEQRVEQAGGGERQRGDVVAERPAEVLLDRAQRRAREADRVGRGAQVAARRA